MTTAATNDAGANVSVEAATSRSLRSTALVYAGLIAVLLSGFVLRLILFSHGVFEGDAQTFRDWAVRLVDTPLPDFYASARPADHLPGDLWFLWGVAHIYHHVSPAMNVQSSGFLFLLKLVPATADVVIGTFIFAIARSFAGPRAGLLGAALFMFNPASIFLTAIWGQWDSTAAAVMLAGLWLLLCGRPAWSLPLFTFAALIKPQLGLLLVLALFAWLCWGPRRHANVPAEPFGWMRRLRGLALGVMASIAVFLAIDLPFNVGLPLMPTRWTIIDRMSYALNEHTTVSANAFNLWGMFGRWSNIGAGRDAQAFVAGMSYQHWGEALLGAAVLLALILFWMRPDRSMALWASLAITFSLFMLPTRIHERYLMPALVFGVLVAVISASLRWLGIALSLTYFANIFYVYHYFNRFGFGSGSNPSDLIPLLISTINVFLLVVVFAAGFALVFGDRQAVRRQKLQESDTADIAGSWSSAGLHSTVQEGRV